MYADMAALWKVRMYIPELRIWFFFVSVTKGWVLHARAWGCEDGTVGHLLDLYPEAGHGGKRRRSK